MFHLQPGVQIFVGIEPVHARLVSGEWQSGVLD